MVADDETRTTWLHFEGAAINGPLKGRLLDRIPVYHTTWAEWRELHPHTEVILPPSNPIHRDCRDGHASEEACGRAGISPGFVRTLLGPLDTRLDESRLVLAVTLGASTRVYPLAEVKREGRVVHDVLAGEPIVVWAGPAADSFTMAAYSRRVEGRLLEFERADKSFKDKSTATLWSVDGRALRGELAGRSLTPLCFSFLRWHGWAWAHKSNDLFLSQQSQPAAIEAGEFATVVETLRKTCFDVRIEEEAVNLMRPNEAKRGLLLRINQDRFHLWSFRTRSAAEDYAYWNAHSARAGPFVLESDPEERLKFADGVHSRMVPDEQIPWSKLLNADDLVGKDFLALLARQIHEKEKEETGLMDLLERLKRTGYSVEVGENLKIEGVETGKRVVEVSRSQLRVHALNALIAYLNGDRFLVYKFRDEQTAEAYCQQERQARRGGRFVFRSVPAGMYSDRNGFVQRPDGEIEWSGLLADESFAAAIKQAAVADPRWNQ